MRVDGLTHIEPESMTFSKNLIFNNQAEDLI